MDRANGKKRGLVFHPNDQRNLFRTSVAWASPNYLLFRGERTALIDVNSLKMSYPVTKESGFIEVEFIPDFITALGRKKDGHYLGRVELNESPR